MARFHISRVMVNRHHEMYEEVIQTMMASLIALGHNCTTSTNHFVEDSVNILLGSTIFGARHLKLTEALRGKPYIVYQLEQLDDAHGLLKAWPEYDELLANASWIWDYAPSSTAFLRARGFPRVAYLPPGFHPCLDTFRPAVPPLRDIIFLGTPHPRRAHVLAALRTAGCVVEEMFGMYGAERNAIIARGRIVLNIHAWDDLDYLETIRLSLLLANHCFVISETSDHNPYDDGVVYADYDALVATCLDYLRRPTEERAAIAARGGMALRRQDMIGLMRGVITETLNLI